MQNFYQNRIIFPLFPKQRSAAVVRRFEFLKFEICDIRFDDCDYCRILCSFLSTGSGQPEDALVYF